MNFVVKSFMNGVRSSLADDADASGGVGAVTGAGVFPQPLALPKRTSAVPVNKSRRGMVMFAATGSARGAETFGSVFLESTFLVSIAVPPFLILTASC
jgi:hypothetical protein